MGKEAIFLVAGMAFVTVIPRVLPIWLLSDRRLSPIMDRWLALIAPAILSALLFPELLLNRSQSPAVLMPFTSNVYLPAAIVSFITAWKTKSLFCTVVMGGAAVAFLRFFMA